MSYCRIAEGDQALNYRSNESILNAISMREACVVWRMFVKIKSDATAAELGRLPVAYRRACPVSRTLLAAGCEIKEDWVVG